MMSWYLFLFCSGGCEVTWRLRYPSSWTSTLQWQPVVLIILPTCLMDRYEDFLKKAPTLSLFCLLWWNTSLLNRISAVFLDATIRKFLRPESAVCRGRYEGVSPQNDQVYASRFIPSRERTEQGRPSHIHFTRRDRGKEANTRCPQIGRTTPCQAIYYPMSIPAGIHYTLLRTS
jgi:hypothetical protein